jgi:hypothetical protein
MAFSFYLKANTVSDESGLTQFVLQHTINSSAHSAAPQGSACNSAEVAQLLLYAACHASAGCCSESFHAWCTLRQESSSSRSTKHIGTQNNTCYSQSIAVHGVLLLLCT